MPFKNKQYRILIVDDVPSNIRLLGNFLREEKYHIAFSHNGQDALEKLKSTEYDLILLDIMMPEMNGFQVCEKIKSDFETKDIPIIFLTAKDDSKSIVKGFDLGAVDYITKPFNYKELLSRIRTHLQIKGQQQIIESMNQLLEKRVSERTQQLKDANERLLNLDNAKNEFLSLINHELRTPLSGISGYTDLLGNSVKGERELEFVSKLKESTKNLTKLIDIALLITSLRSDKYKMDITKISVNELINQIVEKTAKKTRQKNISIDLHLLTPDDTILADHKLISVSLENILRNAISHSPDFSKVAINILNNEQNISIGISDQGPGFSNLSKERQFEIFSKKDIIHHVKGFGLGLAVSKLVTDAHAGNLEIVNNETIGATVTIQLPK